MTTPGAAAALPETTVQRERKEHSISMREPRYNVILWNDDDHSYAYVVAMMMELFAYTPEKGYLIAREVDTQGRAIVLTTTKEHAELKCEQIQAYGKDDLIEHCKGSMWATIEPVPGEG